jgi:signal transduction histidine kinase
MQNKHTDFIVLGSSLFITFAILGLFYSYILIQKDHEFDLIANELTTSIANRLVNYEQVLFATQGLFIGSNEVTADEWKNFVQNQQIENRFPGVQVVGYSQKIGGKDELAQHLQKMHINNPNYTVHPDVPRQEYHSVIFIEPVNDRNQHLLGYDMFTESVQRSALEQARDTGTVTISGVVQEVAEDAQPGFSMFLPVYRNDQPHQTIVEKQGALQGFVYCAFRTYDLFNAMFPDLPQAQTYDIRIKVYDTEKSDANLLYDSKKGLAESDWSKSKSLEYGHRKWILELDRTRTFTNFETMVMVAIPVIGVSMSAFVFLAIRSNQRNLSRIMLLNEELLKREKMSAVGQLASRLAHDIRNPLSVIKNTIEILSQNNSDEKLRLQLERMDRATVKINRQITDILDFVRTKPLEIQVYSSQKIINETLDRIEKPSGITINVLNNDCPIKCDSERIETALVNLITNSIQALNEEGTINIRVLDNDKFTTIEVEDSGPGIPEEILPKIFEPLFTTKPTGTGLGLASVKNIIEQHGGSIYVKNKPTIFTIHLPK